MSGDGVRLRLSLASSESVSASLRVPVGAFIFKLHILPSVCDFVSVLSSPSWANSQTSMQISHLLFFSSVMCSPY